MRDIEHLPLHGSQVIQSSGSHGDRSFHMAVWWHQWVYCDVCSWSWWQLMKHLTIMVCT